MEPTNDTTRILLVDDHKIVRDGIISLLHGELHIEIIGQAENGIEALDKIEKLKPDLALLDINMPIMDGLECAKRISEKFPEVKILILTMLNELEHIKNMLAAGAGGYILKSSGKDELIAAINSVMMGNTYFSEEVKDLIMMDMMRKKTATGKVVGEPIPLTPRELDVLKLIVDEFTNQEIADKLFISVRTVDAHRRNLLEKTGSRNTAGLVKFALENDLTGKK
ncbi:MAG: response regulator transcription factor [Candidatus Moranbacteria bacterium]|nr:response regulator transcription factor [Candidatus Moranbacteria bacterium]